MCLDFFLEFRSSSDISSLLFLDRVPPRKTPSLTTEFEVESLKAIGAELIDGSEEPAILVDDSEVRSSRSRSAFLAEVPNFLICVPSENEIIILNFALTVC